MTGFIVAGDNRADAITGERIYPNDVVFNTGVNNEVSTFARNGRTRVIKESTIVWLAEAAGYDVVKRDAGDSGDAEVVDESDVSGGGGAPEVGKAKGGRKPAAKRRADGPIEGE
jgi:hypothetical protein